jgi:hypothetical protein
MINIDEVRVYRADVRTLFGILALLILASFGFGYLVGLAG